MRTILLATVLLCSACKKKEEAKPAEPAAAAVQNQAAEAQKSAEAALAKAGESVEQAEQAAAMATAAAAGATAAAGVALANAVEYEKKAIEVTDKVLAIFKAHGTNCDKLAVDLTKFGTENKATFDAIKAFEAANPAAEKAFEDKMDAREEEMEKVIGPAFDACKGHEGMKKAMSMALD
jgi:hypothetical protein